MSSSNLPSGCSVSDLPDNTPEDAAWDELYETLLPTLGMGPKEIWAKLTKGLRKWKGIKPYCCDICGKFFQVGAFFVDGKMCVGFDWPDKGRIMHEPCHKEKGCGLGFGKGQKYHWASLVKVES